MVSAPESVKKMLVVGGAAGMGRWMVSHVFSNEDNLEITISDTDPGADEKAKQLGVHGVVIRYDGDKVIGHLDIGDYDIVVIAVPIDETLLAIKALAPKMKENSLLTDVTSVKVMPIEQMSQHAPRTVSIIGTHPLFGVNQQTIVSENVIFIPVPGRCDPKWGRWLRDIFEKNGAFVVDCTAEEHDYMVAVTQGLTHFAHLALGKTLRALHKSGKEPFTVSRSWDFKTPVYESMISFVGRILAGNPRLYASIQKWCHHNEVRERFVEECQALLNSIKTGELDEIESDIREIAQGFERPNYLRGLATSNRIIDTLAEEKERLYKSLGQLVAIKNIDSNKVHVGLLKDVDFSEGYLLLEEKRGSTGASGKYVIVYDEESQRVARRFGLKTETVKLSLSRARLLSEQELYQWRKDNLKHHERHISVRIPHAANPDIISQVIPHLDTSIVSSGVKDIYAETSDGLPKVLFSVAVMGDKDPAPVVAAIKDSLEGLGCSVS